MSQPPQFTVLGPFFSGGKLVTSPKLYHYVAGTSTEKAIWSDRAQLVTLAQPFVGDANGLLPFFGSGLYKFVVKTNNDAVTLLGPVDNVQLGEALSYLDGEATWDPPALSPGQSATSPAITVTGAVLGNYVVVTAPYDLQGIRATAYVETANTVKIVLERPLSMLKGSATWNPANRADGDGETITPVITVTGAVPNDAVLVYPPYDLQDTLIQGYVQANNSVEIRFQNESGASRDLASGEWHVGVIPRGTPIDLASGLWRVRVLL